MLTPSYTIPGIGAFKDGASWVCTHKVEAADQVLTSLPQAALEYAKNVRDTGRLLSTGGSVSNDPVDVTICIAGITFSDKTKYRSSAVMQCVPSPCRVRGRMMNLLTLDLHLQFRLLTTSKSSTRTQSRPSRSSQRPSTRRCSL